MSNPEDLYINGEWGNYRIRMIEPKDHQRILKFVDENYLQEEPVVKLLGYTKDFAQELLQYVEPTLYDNLSCMAIDKENEEIASIRLTYRVDKGNKLRENGPDFKSRTGKLYGLADDEAIRVAKIWETYNVSHYAYLLIASTNIKYQNKGLAKELYRRNLDLLKAKGYPLTFSVFTSPHSRAAAERLNFTKLSHFDLKDLKDENGQPVFPIEILTPEHYTSVYVKLL